MLEITKDNYLYGTGHGKDFHVHIDPPKKKVRSYFEETVEAIEYVYANKTGKFQVLYSGGVDSQYICEILLKLGMEFEPVIIELHGELGIYNSHETKYAREFCEAKNIKPVIYDLDFDDFYKSGKIVEVAEPVTCCSIALPATLYVASKLDGFTLMGWDPPYVRLEPNGVWVFEQTEYTHTLPRFYKKHNLNGSPFILTYTAEMLLSFLLDPTIKKLCTGQLPGKTGVSSSKSHVYNNGSGFNIPVYDFVTKTRVKYHGYERIFRTEIMNHPNLAIFEEFQKKWNGEYLEPYADLVKRLLLPLGENYEEF